MTLQNSIMKSIKPTYPSFTNPGEIPWVQWVMEGTYFKLLNVNELTGGFTMLLKVDAHDDPVPVHGHVGGVEVYVIDGEFGYDDDRGAAGWYGFEQGGTLHEPNSPGGTTMFAIAHGPIIGYNPDGTVAAVVDAKFMYQMAKEAGTHKHLRVGFPGEE